MVVWFWSPHNNVAKARGLTLLLDITQLHFDSTIPRSCKVCHLGPFPKSGGSSATRISTGLLGSSVHASSPIRFYVYAYFLIASGSEAGRPIGEKPRDALLNWSLRRVLPGYPRPDISGRHVGIRRNPGTCTPHH